MIPRPSRVLVTNPDRQLPCYFSKTVLRIPSKLTRPLFSIPVHQFIFNGGNVDKKFFMDNLQLEESEYALIRDPQRGSCLYKCGNERYLLQVQAPEYKQALFGTAGGR